MKGRKLTIENLKEMDGKQVYVSTYLLLGVEGIYTVDMKNNRLYRKEINNYEASLYLDSIKNGYSRSLDCNIYIFEWIEDKQENIIDDSEIKVGDYVYYYEDWGARYNCCKINKITIDDSDGVCVWGYWLQNPISVLPNRIEDFDILLKDKYEGFMPIIEIKKLNLIDDTQLNGASRNESKTGITNNLNKSKEFTKSDLKTGMWIETREGDKGLVLLNTNNGDIIAGNIWCSLSEYNNDLKYFSDYRAADIVKIYQPKSNREYYNFEIHNPQCIWQREENPINYRADKYSGLQDFNNETVNVNQEENKTTVTLSDNTQAEVFCDENTSFDVNKGLEIAYWKAKELQAKNMRNKVKGE